jgi:hypothetical protein
MEDHSNNELQELRERYIQRIKIFKSYSIEEFAREVQNDDISVGIEVSPDADSFVFGTQLPSDFHCLNSTVCFHFQRAVPSVRPFSVRPAIKKTKWFQPSYRNGKIPNLPSKLHKFPSFSAGTVQFNGGVNGYLSIHLLEETKLGTCCSPEVTQTWNVANNLALNKYKDSSVNSEQEWERDMEEYRKYTATQNYKFADGGAHKSMIFPGISGILHLRIVYDMLRIIGHASHGENSAGADPGAAKLLCTKSFILLQAPGFKKQWGMMQSPFDQQEPVVFQVENYKNDYSRWNQKLKAMTTDTYQRAEAFFINLPRLQESNHGESAFYAIDIAFKIGCNDDNWDVLLSGKVAEETVLAATKLRRAELWEEDEESSEHDDSSQETIPSDSDATARLEWDPDEEEESEWMPTGSRDQERADDNDPESRSEDQVADNDDNGPISELLELMDIYEDYPNNNPNESSGQAQQEGHETHTTEFLVSAATLGQAQQEGHETNTAEFLESAATLHSGKMERIRYPTFGTTGIAFGNAQNKPGINLEAARTDGGLVCVFHPNISEGKLRSVSLAQLYHPYQRFGMGVQTMVKTRLEARKLPKMIAEYASEFESLLVGDSSTQNETKAFALIDDIFFMIKEYLAGVATHPLHVRYELTFVTQMDRRLDILPPINDKTSPFKCVRLAKKDDMLGSMKKLIDMHREVMDGFRKLKEFPNLSTTIHANEWTAIIASAEAVVNFIGMGGGAKGTILKQSLDKAPEFFFEHYWMAHPNFITLHTSPAESMEGNINQPGTDIIRFGVDSNLLALAAPQRAIEDDASNRAILQSSLDYVDGTLSMYLLEGLPKLDEPAPYRKCMLLIYTALLAAGKVDDNTEVTIFDCIQWAGVGEQVASVDDVFKEIAAALVALYKVEWANRNTHCIEKRLRQDNSEEGTRIAADFQNNRKAFILDMRDSHTKKQLGALIQTRLGNDWPFAGLSSPFDSDNNSSKMTQAGRAT